MLDKKIINNLKPLKLKYSLKRTIDIILIALMLWGGFSFSLMFFSRFFPITFIWNKILLSLVFSLVSALLWSFYKRPSYKEVAMLIDTFGLKERTSTSLELMGDDSLISRIQKEDTLRLLEKEDIKSKISLKPSKKVILFILVFIIATITVSLIPTKSHVLAKEKEEKIEKLEEEKAKIEKITDDIEENRELTEEEKKKLNESLEEIKKSLDKSMNIKDAQKEIVKLKKEINNINEIRKQKRIDEIVKALENKSFTKELAEKLKNRSIDEIAKEIEKTANKLKDLDKDELKRISQELKELQEILKNNPELAEAFNEIRDAIEQSIQQGQTNNEVINQSFQNLNQTINDMLNNSELSSELNEVLNGINELNSTVDEISRQNNYSNNNSQSKSSEGENSGQGNQSQPSVNSSGNNSQSPSEGNQSNKAGGNGAGDGSTQGNDGKSGSSQSGDGNRQSSSNEDAMDYERIFTTERLNADGEKSQIHGNVNESGEKDIINVKKFGEEMGESIPFNEVYRNYRDSEYERLEQEEIPPNMKEIVKKYFIKLDE